MENKSGQMKISFGMIFSIILIIVFLVFTFYAIKMFLGTGVTAQLVQFKDSLQSDIDKVWRASQGAQEQDYFLPNKIQYVCFVDFTSEKKGVHSQIYDDMKFYYFGQENLFFYPSEGIDGLEIKHIVIEDITYNQNPYCIEAVESHIKLSLSKDFNETLVTISKI